MSTLWEDTHGCAKQYMCDFAIYDLNIYLTTVLSSSYGIIMDRVINAPGHVNNVFDGLNTTIKCYTKEQLERMGKLSSNNISDIRMIPSDSKDVSIKFAHKCIHILNNKDSLNGIKGSTKIQNT